jgi:hypothetical protein
MREAPDIFDELQPAGTNMAAKDLKSSRDARERILRGVDILADAVKVTPGPRAATS